MSTVLSFVMRSDWRYLLRHTRDGRAPDHDAERSRDYYTSGEEHGEPPGRWWGRGAESLGLGGDVAEEIMEKVYGAMVNPRTGEPLGSAPRAYATYEDRLAQLVAKERDATPERMAEIELEAHKSHRDARHYADLTFSPPKSWSVLHAALEHAGRHDEAAAVWDAWEAGAHAGLEYLMDEAGYSRAGYHGAKVAGRTSGRWVDAHDYVISLFRHHTNRDGEPQLHIHAAVLNRVECADGVWRSLDSAAITSARPAAGALSERVAEERLTAALGVRFRTSPDGKAREIAGIGEDVRDLFSSRRRAITQGVAELAAAYEAKHHKAPSAYVLRLMAEHVTLKTRDRKPDRTPSREQLLGGWERAIQRQLGSGLADVLAGAGLDPGRELRAESFTPEKVIRQAIADVEATKAVWTRHDLIAGIIRHLPDELGGLTGQQVRALAGDLADRALTVAVDEDVITLNVPELIPVPDELRRADGRSVFEPHRPDRYATLAQLQREEGVLTAARQSGGPQLAPERIARLLATTQLTADQVAAVTKILGSGKRLEVLVGPAGTGKSYTVGTLVELWHEAFGQDVFGIAVSQNAVEVLRAEGIRRGANVHQFLQWHENLAAGEIPEAYRGRFALRPGQLLVIDEASMIPTVELARLVQIANAAGAKVLVTGDPHQLGAVGVGGAMQLLVDQVGAVRLSEVRRFDALWEREASLRLREGDTGALIEYDRRGRLVGGPKEAMSQAALNGFLGDYLAGKRAVLVVDDNERAAELSSKVRQELAGLGLVEADGAELHNGTLAGAGDVIQTRQNEYRLQDPVTGQRFMVINREIWKVEKRALVGGGLVVRRELARGRDGEQRWGAERHLPASYVREHVELAYAATVHAVQGRTVDTGHLLVDQATDLAAFYVGLTRGVKSNVAYVVTEGNEHRLSRLSEVLQRAEPERAATHIQGEEFDAVDHLGRLGPVWTSLITEDAAERYHSILISTLGQKQGEATAAEEASGALYRLLRTAELSGQDVPALVAEAVASRELDSADSVAQVLYHRIDLRLANDRAGRTAGDFLPRSYASRTPLTSTLPEPVGDYIRAVAEAMDERAAYLAAEAAAAPPAWAEQLGAVPEDPLARMEWTERAAAVAAYREHFGFTSDREAIGPAPRAADPERRVAWEQAADALGIRGAEREMARHSEGELLNLIDAYAREEAWLPPNVDDRLRTAHLAARESDGSVARLRAQLDHLTSTRDAQAAEIQARLARAEALAARMRDRAATLDEIAEVRTAAVASVADVEAAARAARAELRHRGIDPETLRRDDADRHVQPAPTAVAAATTQHAEPRPAPERDDHAEIDRIPAAGRTSAAAQRAERPVPTHEATAAEPALEDAQAGHDLAEAAPREADLVPAREAAGPQAAEDAAKAEREAGLGTPRWDEAERDVEPEPVPVAAADIAEPGRAPAQAQDEDLARAPTAVHDSPTDPRPEDTFVTPEAPLPEPGYEPAAVDRDLAEFARLQEDLALVREAAGPQAAEDAAKVEREADPDTPRRDEAERHVEPEPVPVAAADIADPGRAPPAQAQDEDLARAPTAVHDSPTDPRPEGTLATPQIPLPEPGYEPAAVDHDLAEFARLQQDLALVRDAAGPQAAKDAAKAEREADLDTPRRDEAERHVEPEPVPVAAADIADPGRAPAQAQDEDLDRAPTAVHDSPPDPRAEGTVATPQIPLPVPVHEPAVADPDLAEFARLQQDLALVRDAANRTPRPEREREPEPADAVTRQAQPERAPTMADKRDIDQALAVVRGSSPEQRAERPGAERKAPVKEPPTRDAPEAGGDLDESTRLQQDLAKAREAAERLAAKQAAKVEREAGLDLDAALRAVRGEQVQQQQHPPPQPDQGREIGGP